MQACKKAQYRLQSSCRPHLVVGITVAEETDLSRLPPALVCRNAVSLRSAANSRHISQQWRHTSRPAASNCRSGARSTAWSRRLTSRLHSASHLGQVLGPFTTPTDSPEEALVTVTSYGGAMTSAESNPAYISVDFEVSKFYLHAQLSLTKNASFVLSALPVFLLNPFNRLHLRYLSVNSVTHSCHVFR